MGLDALKKIKAVISDVDGVMTDGAIIVNDLGETKRFSVRDGLGIKLLQKGGLEFAILSGRHSKPLRDRAEELGIKVVKTGRIDKETAWNEIIEELGIPAEACAYIGDDLPDLAPLQLAAVGFCPQDAAPEVLAQADFVVPASGGQGVVRHVVEMVLKAQDLWAPMVSAFEVKS